MADPLIDTYLDLREQIARACRPDQKSLFESVI